MTALPITLTTAGMAAIAALAGTDQVTIAQVGLTNAVFVAAATLTGLPGEFMRIDGVGGEAVDPQTIHITARDPGTGAYSVRGFALYLADGTLFAAYCQPLPIFTKVAAATFLLAADIRFAPGIVGDITFGNANFLYPPATETVKGVAELATQAEADTGTDDQRIVTPKKLAGVMTARLAAYARLDGATFTGAISAPAVEARGSTDVGQVIFHRPGTILYTAGGYGDGAAWGLKRQDQAAPAFGVDSAYRVFTTVALNVGGNLTAEQVFARTPNDGSSGGFRLIANAGSQRAYLQVLDPTASAQWGAMRFDAGGEFDWNTYRVFHAGNAASDVEAIAGTLTDKALTPHSGAALVAQRIAQLVNSSPAALDTLAELATALGNDPNFAASVNAALAARVQTVNGKGAPHVTLGPADVGAPPSGRTVSAGGIVTGGGSLANDITITVTAASGPQTQAGTAGDLVVTPAALWSFARSLSATGYAQIPGTALILQWGSATLSINANQTITLPIAFPSTCAHVLASLQASPNDGDEDDEVLIASPLSNSQISIGINGVDGIAVAASWLAIGW